MESTVLYGYIQHSVSNTVTKYIFDNVTVTARRKEERRNPILLFGSLYGLRIRTYQRFPITFTHHDPFAALPFLPT